MSTLPPTPVCLAHINDGLRSVADATNIVAAFHSVEVETHSCTFCTSKAYWGLLVYLPSTPTSPTSNNTSSQ